MKAPHLQIGTRWFPWWFWIVIVAGVGVLGFNFGSRLLLTNDDTRFPVLAREWAFATAWSAVVAVGAVVVWVTTPRFNATTDLRELRAVLAEAPAPVIAIDLQDLALSFNLDRPVVRAKTLRTFEDWVRGGERAYLVISDRAVSQQGAGNCLRPVARDRVTRQQFLVLEPVGCDKAGPSAGMPRAG